MITPAPNKAKWNEGSFILPENASFSTEDALSGAKEGIRTLLPMLSSDGEGAQIRFLYDASLPEEAYKLDIDASGAQVAASGIPGAVHAAATLRQLFASKNALPHCEIEDAPRFSWRGLSMDVCRHFFPVSTLEKLIDALALYKFNTLHLHLSDDQGYRIESERFPKLNSVSAWRKSSAVKRGHGEVQDNIPHGGFYTKAEIKSLVAYAGARGIMIVPEIDMPGHTSAILAAYPALACDGRATEVATNYGIKDFSAHILCAGEENVYDFLTALIDEIAELFPAPYFHLGGDEAVKREWKKCPKCQAKLHELGLSDERELQGYMLERMRKHLEEIGKEAIIWNDGMAGTTGKAFICQHWTPPAIEGEKRTAAHLEAGGRAIMSGFNHLYFDYPYAMTPLEKTYSYRVLPKGVSKEAASRVLGLECAMWTEWVEDENKLFFNLLPRLAAAGELAWSRDAARDYGKFTQNLNAQYRIYEQMGLPCARGMERKQGFFKRANIVRAFYTRDAYVELPRE